MFIQVSFRKAFTGERLLARRDRPPLYSMSEPTLLSRTVRVTAEGDIELLTRDRGCTGNVRLEGDHTVGIATPCIGVAC